ncbi:MAG: hypothetical protein Q8N23_32970 [Archangium sp.]|nr:hypothetical protein [Archangium sp.]MDP3157528.1 hypothetical protein [Archangium sp.]MDP3574292.1 hypothetical protein [Archangium sp.]
MIALVLSLVVAAPFPLPAIDGKPLAVSEGQKVFRLPMRFEKVKSFYLEQLGASATVIEKSVAGNRVLHVTAKGKAESWVKAVVREGEVDTVIEVTPVMRLAEEEISGNGRPLVEFIIGRSGDVQKALNTIDHAEQMRSK